MMINKISTADYAAAPPKENSSTIHQVIQDGLIHWASKENTALHLNKRAIKTTKSSIHDGLTFFSSWKIENSLVSIVKEDLNLKIIRDLFYESYGPFSSYNSILELLLSLIDESYFLFPKQKDDIDQLLSAIAKNLTQLPACQRVRVFHFSKRAGKYYPTYGMHRVCLKEICIKTEHAVKTHKRMAAMVPTLHTVKSLTTYVNDAISGLGNIHGCIQQIILQFFGNDETKKEELKSTVNKQIARDKALQKYVENYLFYSSSAIGMIEDDLKHDVWLGREEALIELEKKGYINLGVADYVPITFVGRNRNFTNHFFFIKDITDKTSEHILRQLKQFYECADS